MQIFILKRPSKFQTKITNDYLFKIINRKSKKFPVVQAFRGINKYLVDLENRFIRQFRARFQNVKKFVLLACLVCYCPLLFCKLTTKLKIGFYN